MIDPKMLTPAQIEEIRDRTEKATDGPWRLCPKSEYLWSLNDDYSGEPTYTIVSEAYVYGVMCEPYSVSSKNEYDHEFIAHARADIPALLSHIAALEAERDELQKFRDKMDCYMAEKDTAEKQTAEICAENERLRNTNRALENDNINNQMNLKLLDEEVERLREAQPASVTWHQENEDENAWECSGCGCMWVLFEGDPFDNNMKFCPRCGAQITSVSHREYDQETGDYKDVVKTLPAPPEVPNV